MINKIKVLLIFTLFLSLIGCSELNRKDVLSINPNVFQSVKEYDTVWVRPSGTVFVLGDSVKSFDISEYSISGINRNDSIILTGGFNNLEPSIAMLFVLLENDSTKEFTIAISKDKGSFYAYLDQSNK